MISILTQISKSNLLRRDDITEEDKNILEEFTGGMKWVRNFVKRQALHSITLHGTGGDADATLQQQRTVDELNNLKYLISNYKPENVFNMDETSLYYKCLPNKSFLVSRENKKEARGSKTMTDKSRLTAFICTNAVGNKVPLSYIGKFKKPRCFTNNPHPVEYFHQQNAWCDKVVIEQWFHRVFIPFIRTFTNEPVLLIMDNFGAHNVIDDLGQIRIASLPPNVTSRKQPMDMGVIQNWKQKYKYTLLNSTICRLLNTPSTVYNFTKPGIDILDASHIGKYVWDRVTPNSISRCWIKAKILPEAMEQAIQENRHQLRSSDEVSLDSIVNDITNLLSSDIIETTLQQSNDDDDNVAIREAREAVHMDPSAVQVWFNIDDDLEIREAQLFDEFESAMLSGGETKS